VQADARATSLPSDDELLERLRRGDGDALRPLVQRYERLVAATVIGMLGTGDEADDVGQETFIRFYQSVGRFRGDASVATYLRRIAMNLSLNTLARRRRWFARHDALDIEMPDPRQEELQDDELHRIVRMAVVRLNEKHRAVVVLRMMEGCSTRETALALDVPEGTVLSRLSRAMEQLERDLAPYVREGRMPFREGQ
jgi:RNA polymerase sigma-70 factor, ECF subfamily